MKQEQLLVRKGQLDDLPDLQKLFMETVTTICQADYDQKQIEVWISSVENEQRWIDIVTKQFVLVAQQVTKIVGFVTLDNENYIDLLYVHKDYQRQGIASKLYADIETKARKLKQTTLTSDVSKTARCFFENNGFRVLAVQTVNKKGIDLINYKMIKILE